MAFNPSNVSAANPGSYPWQIIIIDYTTSDTLATVEGSSYFSEAGQFRPFELLRVTATDGKALYKISSAIFGSGLAMQKLASGVTSFPSL